MLSDEQSAGLESIRAYASFNRAEACKFALLKFLLEARRNRKRIFGYGAAKGNTLLNYAGIKSDLLTAVADRAISKQRNVAREPHPCDHPRELMKRIQMLCWCCPGILSDKNTVTNMSSLRRFQKSTIRNNSKQMTTIHLIGSEGFISQPSSAGLDK